VISTVPRARSGSAREAALGLDEIERVARIGSYSLDIASGRWVSSPGLDAILGIGATFERSVEGWASLVAPADRAAMVAYLTDEVLGAGTAFDRRYRVIRADNGEERWVHGHGALEVDGSGRPTRMLGTIADITEVQRAMAQVNKYESERAALSAALARLEPGPTLEATATVICEELLGLPGIDAAAVINFLGPERAVPLAVLGADGMPLAAGRPLPALRAAYLYERAANGPWADVLQERSDYTFHEELARVGLLASAYAPIRNGEGLLGVVTVATHDPAFVRHLVDRLPVVSEFAATAGALMSAQLEAGHREVRAREHIGHVLAERGYRPVFQPIVDLASGKPVGFEALTRFTDGTPPDRMIAEAHQAGLGLELELACLTAALDASETLPAGAWLSLNAAPVVILQANDLAALLADRPRRLVLEVTEHTPIDDYAALRQAVAGFGVDLAVDDAGSGFASMQHIVELAPRYLKLDVSLVRHVDRDVTRQAMAAGMCHFASRIGCEVIAEGIEDAAELAMLRELGVPLGQGYLLGRPAPPPAMPQGTRQLGAKDPRPARSA
jgi:EAL domain-containing protein (putative c-di-GMP-specific phosphodiesterase class I)